MTRLAVANVAVAGLAAALAIVSANLWRELAAETTWGPDLYIAGAWVTSALSIAAWWPPQPAERTMWLGSAISFAWAAWMTQFALFLNVWMHLLAAGFFAATAWQSRSGHGPQDTHFPAAGQRAARWVTLVLAGLGLAWILLEVGSGPVDVPPGPLFSYMAVATVLVGVAYLDTRTGHWALAAMVLGAVLWWVAPDRFDDPVAAMHGYAGGVALLGILAGRHQSSGSGLGTS